MKTLTNAADIVLVLLVILGLLCLISYLLDGKVFL